MVLLRLSGSLRCIFLNSWADRVHSLYELAYRVLMALGFNAVVWIASDRPAVLMVDLWASSRLFPDR